MKTLSARIAGLSRLTRTLLAVAGALLVIVIIAGVVLATNPALSARLSGALPGEATTITYPPGWVAGGTNVYKLRPGHVTTEKYLAINEWLFQAFNGAYVVLWDWDGNHTQNREFYFEEDSAAKGYFRIYCKMLNETYSTTNTYLAVRNDSRTAGADVIGWMSDPGGNNHLWKLYNEDGVYFIQSKSSGLCLEIRDASKDNGAALIQSSCNKNLAQQAWGLHRVQ